MLSNLPIRYKLFISYSAAFILTVSLGSIIIYSTVNRTIESRIESELKNTTYMILNMVRTAADASIKNNLRAVAEKNREIARHIYGEFKDGKISETEAKKLTKSIFLSQTIGKTGYIYCLNSRGVIVVHPKPRLLGTDLSEYPFIRIQKVRKEGYIEYEWKNPGETKTRPKALYMTYFAPWDWIISASSYRDEFRNLVHEDDFRESIVDLSFGKTGHVCVFDLDGRQVIKPNEKNMDFSGEIAENKEFVKALIKQRNGKLIYTPVNSKGGKRSKFLVIFNEIPEYHWIVASYSSLEEIYAPVNTVRKLMIGTVAISLLIFLPVTLFLGASITRRLKELAHNLDDVTKGKVGTRIHPKSMDEVGKLISYFNTFMDRLEAYNRNLKLEMDERIRTEEAIRESEKKYRELVQNANSMILRVAPTGIITFMNTFALEFFGYREEDITGCHINHIIVPLEISPEKNLMNLIESMVGNSGASVDNLIACTRKNSERVWVSWTIRSVYDKKGDIFEYLCIGNDMTARMRMDEMMVQTEKMLSVGGLAAGMAHEINNPLGAMVQNTQNIIRRLSPDLDSNIQEADNCGADLGKICNYVQARGIDKLLKDIRDSGARAAAIVTNMLNFSRRSASRIEPVDLALLLDQTIELASHDYDLKKRYDFKDIEIKKEFDQNLPLVKCEAREIGQVVLNLLKNAAQAMADKQSKDHKPEITIRLKLKTATAFIEIEDNGPGMDESTRKRIFEPFFTTKSIGEGTGLGLSVSFFIVTSRHQGTITVESEPGKGARFIIGLPVRG